MSVSISVWLCESLHCITAMSVCASEQSVVLVSTCLPQKANWEAVKPGSPCNMQTKRQKKKHVVMK